MRRPTRGVKGRIGAGSLLQGARVARIAECRLEQKVGYDRHTDHISNSKLTWPVFVSQGVILFAGVALSARKSSWYVEQFPNHL